MKAMFSKAAKTNNIQQRAVGNPQYIKGAMARRDAENALRQGRGMMFGGIWKRFVHPKARTNASGLLFSGTQLQELSLRISTAGSKVGEGHHGGRHKRR